MTLHNRSRAALLAVTTLLLAGCDEIVGFARDLHLKNGLPVAEAAIEAARIRLRPILMTSLAFILALVPLVLASGAGANAQKSIGFATLTGMLGSTCSPWWWRRRSSWYCSGSRQG
jgi:Cu/Ag efflux pump CusA